MQPPRSSVIIIAKIIFIRNYRSLGGAFNKKKNKRPGQLPVSLSFPTKKNSWKKTTRKVEQIALPQNIFISSATSNSQNNEIRIHSPFVKITSQIVDIRLIFIQPNFSASCLYTPKDKLRKFRNNLDQNIFTNNQI